MYAGNEIDYHYISLDNQTKLTVYNENGIITKIQDFFTYSEEPYPQNKLNNYNLHLYKRNYVGFNLTCLGDQVLNEETTKYLYKYFDAYNILRLFAGALFGFSGLLVFCGIFVTQDELKKNNLVYFECRRNETFDELFFCTSCPSYIALV